MKYGYSLLGLCLSFAIAAISLAPATASAAPVAGGVHTNGLIGFGWCMLQEDTTTTQCIKDNLEMW